MEVVDSSSDLLLGVEESIRNRRWTRRTSNDRAARRLAQSLQISDTLAGILAGRGIDEEGAENFLSPMLREMLPNPSVFTDMDKAAERLADAIQSGENIAVFGDYDVDGATSGALLVRFIDLVGGCGSYYIPDRIKEGYGPNAGALRILSEQGASLIITVDCGISAFSALADAAKAKLSVIVVDHHIAEMQLPEATAIVNPNRLDDESGFGYLAAVGVTFMLLIAVNRELRNRGYFKENISEPDLLLFLDLVALGTVCDVVPLTGLNRAFVSQGLKVMAARKNLGLSALYDIASISEAPTAYHMGYILGPRVNAGGRVGESSLGIKLLTTNTPDIASAIAIHLNGLNKERQVIEGDVLVAATTEAEKNKEYLGILAVAVGNEWHPGVIGIVASRLKEKFAQPAIIVSVEKGIGKGSCRSVPGIDIGALITAARQAGLLINGGGHAMAAGFSVDEEKIRSLFDFLHKRIREAPNSNLEQILRIDCAVTVEGANLELVGEFSKVAPFGAGNAEPRIAIVGARIVSAHIVGNGHIRCVIAGSTGKRLNAIAFGNIAAELSSLLLSKGEANLHLAGYLRLNNWKGRTSLQLIIEDASSVGH